VLVDLAARSQVGEDPVGVGEELRVGGIERHVPIVPGRR
jgi:hypothetical protein